MASKNWSASRVGCFAECNLKYKLQYVEGWKSTAPVNTEKADKGLAFHETVEKYHTGMSQEELWKILEEKIAKYKVNITDETKENYYDYRPAMEKFFVFWEKIVMPKEAEGYKVLQETWTRGQINGEPFVGAIDLCIDNGENLIITDYKTGKSINANSYKPQQLLYAYLKGKEKGWSIEQTCERIKLFIFGPLQEDLPTKTIEQNMLRSVKEIKYTIEDMNEIINSYYIKNIDAIHTMNWSRARGNMTYACSWCPYCGAKENTETGFSGCPATIKAGFMTPDGVDFVK